MRKMNKNLKNLNISVAKAVKYFKAPEELSVSQWADKYRRLSSENSAEAGPWKTSRTPYLREVMDAFTDPKVRRITLVAASQVAKTEMILNMIGYVIDNDPGSMMFVLPTVATGEDLSKRRIAPMIRDCKRLKEKVSDIKSRSINNSILRKIFPGGMLTITGSNSAAGLASTPARYVFGDERDRWALSAGTEGDPWELVTARTTTFYNSKMVEVSTPTIKGASVIESAFYEGTCEHWCYQCPECGEWHNIIFDDIKFDFDKIKTKSKKDDFIIKNVYWACPSCGGASSEEIMRKQPVKWIAENPNAYEHGIRSFWLNAFSSPWMPWKTIVLKFLQSKDDVKKLQVVYNTIFGQTFEDRSSAEDESGLLVRREEYNAELPEGVLFLTCGVDTQGDRLEYEVVGHGKYNETWGIKKGVIMGKPNEKEVWISLDKVIDHEYEFKNGKKIKITMTCVDSGGNHTQDVYEACRERLNKKVFAIKGKQYEGIPYLSPANKVPIRDNKNITCWLYTIGVDAGKANIMSNLKVQEPGPKYCHFPRNENLGYDGAFFNGLLSEQLVQKQSAKGRKWAWVKLAGHNRNEALDCRNYALAAKYIVNPDMDILEKQLKGISETPKKQQDNTKTFTKKRKVNDNDEW